MRHLPSPLLADVNIVDTPGTNVILERQQRLTEEFVPRSDLVLFCMSAGAPHARRPCTIPEPMQSGIRRVLAEAIPLFCAR